MLFRGHVENAFNDHIVYFSQFLSSEGNICLQLLIIDSNVSELHQKFFQVILVPAFRNMLMNLV